MIAATLNSGPAYDAVLDIPGAPIVAEAAEADGSREDSDHQEDATMLVADADEGQLEAEDADGSTDAEAATSSPSSASSIDLSAIPSAEEVTVFSSSDAAAPAISADELAPVSNAFSQLTDGGIDAGFVFVNMSTGAGIAANADQDVYGASSIKGPFVTYICEQLIDGGKITTDTSCATLTESFSSNGSSSVGRMIESTVTQSMNGTFGGLRKAYGGSDYASWLESLGVSPDIHEGGDWYAWYTARDAAKLWAEVYEYVNSGSETAEWLHGLMESTNVSYIRDSIGELRTQLEEREWQMPPVQANPTKLIKDTAESVSGYRSMSSVLDEVTVANKAGWCVSDSGSSIDYDSTSDNAIVTIDGNDYLLCIMTGAPYSERSAANVTNLAAQLIATYDSLA